MGTITKGREARGDKELEQISVVAHAELKRTMGVVKLGMRKEDVRQDTGRNSLGFAAIRKMFQDFSFPRTVSSYLLTTQAEISAFLYTSLVHEDSSS